MATPILRGTTWHLMWRWRGKKKFKSTGIPHDGQFDKTTGKPIPPVEVRRELRKLENTLDAGKQYESKTLADLLQLVQKEYEVNGNDSLPSLKSRLKHLEWFGNLRADRIVKTDFLEYAEHRRKTKNAANATINRELETVMHALRLGGIHPLPERTPLKEAAPRKGFFDDTKIAAITANLPEYLQAPFWFGYYTGWRREETFGLEWSMIDFTAGEIRLWDSKNESARVFPMIVVPGLRRLLEVQDARRQEWQRDGHIVPWVFPRYVRETNTVRRMVDFRKALKSACTAAGYPHSLFHDLRRSAARNLEMSGWPRSMVMYWMGHETESMFTRYRIQSAADIQVVQRMMAVLESGSKAVAATAAASPNPKIIKGNF